MMQTDLKSTLKRIAEGLESGDIKEAVAVLMLQGIITDYTADPRRSALIQEKLQAIWRRKGQDRTS